MVGSSLPPNSENYLKKLGSFTNFHVHTLQTKMQRLRESINTCLIQLEPYIFKEIYLSYIEGNAYSLPHIS